MNRVLHFELGAENPEKLIAFYKQVFGWETQQWEGPQTYWLVTTGSEHAPGINGGIMRHKDGLPRTINTIVVDSVDEYAEKIAAAGGEVVVPKMGIPGVGYQAYCKDPEGIVFGIHQQDTSAKGDVECG